MQMFTKNYQNRPIIKHFIEVDQPKI
jgi:hypothetical protein